MTSWWATRPGQADRVDRHVAGHQLGGARRRAARRVELAVVVQLDDLGLRAMCRDASAAKRIISTAPIAKFGATKTLAPGARRPTPGVELGQVEPGRARPRRARRRRTAARRVVERRVGPREVDDDVGVAEHVGDARCPAPGRRGRPARGRRRPRPRRRPPRPSGRRRRRRRRAAPSLGRLRQRGRDRLERPAEERPRRGRCPRRSAARARTARRPASRRRRRSRRRCAR